MIITRQNPLQGTQGIMGICFHLTLPAYLRCLMLSCVQSQRPEINITHTPTPKLRHPRGKSLRCLTHAHSHITQAVAAMDGYFVLLGLIRMP